MTDFGDQLRRAITGRGLSIRATALRAGCSPGYQSNVIHGRKPLTPSLAARLDRVLGTGDALAACSLSRAPGGSGARQRTDEAGDPGRCRPDGTGTTAQSLREFTSADLVPPQSGHGDEPAAATAGESLLRAAERAAFGQAGYWLVSAP